MGADFLFVAVEIKREKAAVLAAVEKMNFTVADTAEFANLGYYDFEDEAESGMTEEINQRMRDALAEAVEVVYAADQRRDCGWFKIDDNERTFVVTGGTSWGDDPSDAYKPFCLVLEYEKEIM